MKAKLINSKDKETLAQIKQTLKSKWNNSKLNPQQSFRLFDQQISKDANEYIYAILLNQKNEILMIAALFLEYKLTRGLSQIYHLQIEYKKCSKEEELFFQSKVIQMIPGYKITGLHVTQSKYFPPHQIYMQVDFQKASKIKGSL